jgi:hypothetical protein
MFEILHFRGSEEILKEKEPVKRCSGNHAIR